MPEEPRPSPTIDQRLEALAQTVKGLAEEQRVKGLRFDHPESAFGQVTRNLEATLNSIKRLERKATSH